MSGSLHGKHMKDARQKNTAHPDVPDALYFFIKISGIKGFQACKAALQKRKDFHDRFHVE
jgi:hypothetical protein